MGLGEVLVFSYMNLLINGFLVTTPSIVKYSFKMFLQMKVVVFCLGLYTTTLKALSCQRCIESGQLASSAGVFFERAIWSQKCHVETSLREEEMGRVKGGGEREKINFFLSSPSPFPSFALVPTVRVTISTLPNLPLS